MKYVVLLIVGAVLSSCSTTGDPRSGGIFWSPTKAQERVDRLAQARQEAEYQKKGIEDKNSSLKAARKKEMNTY